jgi:hypothetical protein
VQDDISQNRVQERLAELWIDRELRKVGLRG